MAESPFQRDALIWLLLTLKDFFAGQPDVYVSGDMMVYYERGNPAASVSPDVFVTVGVPKLPERRVYQVWREGAPPTVAFEVTSRSSRRTDRREKVGLYARIGVPEYFIYDPPGEFPAPDLLGYRLEAGEYRRIDPDPDGALRSDVLDMRLRIDGGRLALYSARTGERLLSPMERVAELEARLRDQQEHRTDDGRHS